MKSAFECFHEAAKCEQLAREATTEEHRDKFLANARKWRALAEEAQVKNESQIQALRDLS